MTSRRSKLVVLILLILAALAGALATMLVTREQGGPSGEAKTIYYCPMHPDYQSDVQGDCPVCSMRLVPLQGEPGPPSSDMTPTSAKPGITVPSERLQLAGLRTAAVQRLRATRTVRSRGRVTPDETRIVQVHARVSGFIEHVSAAFVGAPVRKGQELFTIVSPELVASQQELLSAIEAAKALRSSRYEWAVRDQLALVDAARARLRLMGMSDREIATVESTGAPRRTVAVTSPVDGVVMERQAFAHGRTVTPDLSLYTLADLSTVWVLAEVPERDVAHVLVGQDALVRIPEGIERAGRVAFIAPFVDPATRTVDVRLEVANEQGQLRIDALVEVEMREDLGEQFVVPDGALLDGGETTRAFVALGGGRIEPRTVTPGPRVEQGRVVMTGLAEGEQVVASAQFVIDSESQIRGAVASWGEEPGATAGTEAPTLTARIETEPSPPRTGSARVTVELTDTGGSPVEDAEVELTLDMPAMGSMAPMRSAARLEPVGEGRYAGTIEFLMPFTWSATITARQDGEVLGVARTTLESR